jgi:hypothetical protein
MVPGYTFMYGSSFKRVIFNPEHSSKLPIDAAAIPLPREDKTPPVTKIYLTLLFNFLFKTFPSQI